MKQFIKEKIFKEVNLISLPTTFPIYVTTLMIISLFNTKYDYINTACLINYKLLKLIKVIGGGEPKSSNLELKASKKFTSFE